ncbi:ribonuclease D [Anaerolinea thermolimosa]|uniref:ribonuclease D n=1 Tax=Anaerolinea thermolimosa TaxID=229919 RepID=UPI000781CA53|nr:ribonuclease D [Anaerolinea thermolimosa]GAP07853.1 ribonuclease D [Anaerolinea thermolimosa]
MVALPLPPPIWVATQAGLRQVAQELLHHRQVAVDTESNGLHAYQEQVCLIQFSTEEADYLIDPLALDDLSALAPIFADPGIEKVFHAAEYDILCLKRDFGFQFENLFDTMLAARILGKPQLGLGALLEEDFGIHLDKKYQRANWARRPLPEVMRSYARLDSHYLIALRNHLYTQLAEKGLLGLAVEDFRHLAQIPPAPVEAEPPNCWRVAGRQSLHPVEAAILQALCDFRDQQARFANVPPFRVLPNAVLAEIARSVPQTLEDLARVPGLSARAFDRYGLGIMEAIERGQKASPVYPPRRQPRPTAAFLRRHEALRKWRKDTGRQLGVESDIILPRDLMNRLVEANPRTPGELARVMADYPWRLEHFGEQILRIIQENRS